MLNKTEQNKIVKISMIAAMARNSRVIGKIGGGIPWHIGADFKYFKEKTIGHPIIMGRKTWEEFNGRPLPNRIHIVVTRDKNYHVPEGHFVCDSIESAIQKATELEMSGEIFIIGGAQIYEAGLKFADRIYITLIDLPDEAEKSIADGPKFPDYSAAGFTKIISSEKSHAENYEFEWVVAEK